MLMLEMHVNVRFRLELMVQVELTFLVCIIVLCSALMLNKNSITTKLINRTDTHGFKYLYLV